MINRHLFQTIKFNGDYFWAETSNIVLIDAENWNIKSKTFFLPTEIIIGRIYKNEYVNSRTFYSKC